MKLGHDMEYTRMFFIKIFICFLFFSAPLNSFEIDFLYVKYIWKISYIIVNHSNKTIAFTPGVEGPLLILVPSLRGWQERLRYIVMINSVEETNFFKEIRDKDGNYRLIYSRRLSIYPAGSVNITFIQYIKVPWSPLGFSFIRKKINLENGEKSKISDIPREMSITYLKSYSYWNTSDLRYKWNLVNETIDRILKKVEDRENILEVASKIADWIEKNIRDINPTNTIKWPSKTIEEGAGGCGDQAVLASTFLRLIGIPSFIYSCIVYVPGKKVFNSTSFTIYHHNIVRHMFSVFYLPNVGWVPLDTTFNDRRLGAIKGAAINFRDNIIIYGQIVYSNPNILNVISLPCENTRIILNEELKVIYPHSSLFLIVSITIGVIVILIFYKKVYCK